ncbi:hypothetical protein LZ198_40225 [Myxococcus sp. K15C18031901]|uniref:hypothetical protein n=1 Tax=Myxococcus dinghuensis TaxID=2906761 RepID=UPI0020A79EFD|nr:hypothetical protein [Myxococcus dinghuensis]MCP3105113.1 hypothetical protein [Myxococcus dinghuensis]
MNARHIRSLVLASLPALFLLGCGGAPAEQKPATETPEDTTSEQSTSCFDECYQASLTCTTTCGASQSACDAATSVCYDSCNRGVGPWLPC